MAIALQYLLTHAGFHEFLHQVVLHMALSNMENFNSVVANQ